jgi:hypothetical protein
MAEAIVKGMNAFMAQALKAVQGVKDEIAEKGTSIRFSADYCNSVVAVLRSNSDFAKYSDAELKLALKAFFEAIVLNAVASELKIIKE